MVIRRWGESDEIINVPGADAYRLEIEDFAKAVTLGTIPRWPVCDAVANMATLDALIASAGDDGVSC